MKSFQRGWVLVGMLLLMGAVHGFAQTVVQGVVTDVISKQPLQYVSVVFKGGRGTVTDSLGRFTLRSSGNIATVQVSYVGYLTQLKPIKVGATQTLDIALETDPKAVNNVTVTSKKRAPYKNKGNPAVELIKRVIENKPLNRMEHYDYAEFQQYEKMQVSITDVADKLEKSKLLKKYQFLFQNKDTTKLEGKTLLPVYIQELISQKYYRRKPEKTKTIVLADKKVNFGEYIDIKGVSSYLNRLYMDIDIYDNDIPLFTYQFLSPIADLGPTFYMYYIRDTITDANGTKLIKLYFTPRNTNDLLFRGNMYITLDGNYSVQKINMFLSKNVNLNFVRELHIDLDYEKTDDNRYRLTKSNIMAEAGITKTSGYGFFGERTVSFKNFKTNTPRPDSIYEGLPTVTLKETEIRPDSFWEANRHEKLKVTESKIYTNIDSLEKMPSFRRTLGWAKFLFSGYTSIGPYFEVGPAAAFYSFNPVEGFKLRFGGRTTPKFNKRLYFENYVAYGFGDEQWKYFLSTTYSLNNKSIYTYPFEYIKLSYQHDTKIPGQDLQFVSEDNILLSMKRGINDKWLYNSNLKLEYAHELPNHMSYSVGFKNWKQEPAGSITYTKIVNSATVNVQKLITTEFIGEFRWAPHEQFYQGTVYRIPIINKYPIFTFRFIAGVKGVLNSQYNYQNFSGRMEKRMYMSQLGYSDVVAEAGYIFGQLPYPLMTIHRANQTYAYQLNSYNLMNFQEFVSDHYAALSIDHHFNGLFFNRVPLLKKLKLREVISAKVLYGGVRDENNPLKNPDLIRYPMLEGMATTFAMDKNVPYFEGSVGVTNIFKLIRIDVVKRFTYLDHANVTPIGIRARFKFDF
jgi:hypothetical protein